MLTIINYLVFCNFVQKHRTYRNDKIMRDHLNAHYKHAAKFCMFIDTVIVAAIITGVYFLLK